MSNSSDYTITSLSGGITQRSFCAGATQAPFGLGGSSVMGIRQTCLPYTSGPINSFTIFQRAFCGHMPCATNLYVGEDTAGMHPTIQSAVDAIPNNEALSCSYNIIITDSAEYSENVVLLNITTSQDSCYGTINHKITLTTSVGASPTIDAGQTAGSGQAALWIRDVNNVTIDGLKFTNWSWTGSPGISAGGLSAIVIGNQNETTNPINNITIKNCTMDGKDGGTYGVYVNRATAPLYPSRITIRDCVVTGTLGDNTQGRYGIALARARNCTIDHNTIRAQDSVGIYVAGHSSEMVGNHNITRNTISNCDDRGIYITNSQNCSIINNLIYDVGSDGRPAIDLYNDIDGLKAYNNTIACDAITDDLIIWNSSATGSNEWKNNIYRYGTATGQAIYRFDVSEQVDHGIDSDWNLFSLIDDGSDYLARCSACPGWVNWPLLPDWQPVNLQDQNSNEANYSWDQPGACKIFNDEGNDDYTLCLNTTFGTNPAFVPAMPKLVSIDIDGNTRFGVPARGCYRSGSV